MENYSKPPIRAPKTQESNERAMKHLQATFGSWRLVDVTGRHRAISESSAQETRPCEDKGRFSGAGNPQDHKSASGVPGIAPGAERGGEEEIPAGEPLHGRRVSGNPSGLFRPHYVTRSEQQIIEFHAPEHLRNVVRIITETGLRVYKELIK